MKRNALVKLALLFAVSYFLLYFLGTVVQISTPLHNWGPLEAFPQIDFMFYLLPIPGFFLVYLSLDWIDDYYKSRFAHGPGFPATFFVVALAAHYISLEWYYANIAQLSGIDRIPFDFFALFLDSAFIVFVLAGLLGWLSHMIMERVGE